MKIVQYCLRNSARTGSYVYCTLRLCPILYESYPLIGPARLPSVDARALGAREQVQTDKRRGWSAKALSRSCVGGTCLSYGRSPRFSRSYRSSSDCIACVRCTVHKRLGDLTSGQRV